VRENRVLAKVVRNRDLLEAKVSDVMEASFPTVMSMPAPAKSPVACKPAGGARRGIRPHRGIITRHDVLDMTAKG